METREVALAHIEDQLSSVAAVASLSTMILFHNTFTVQARPFINRSQLKLQRVDVSKSTQRLNRIGNVARAAAKKAMVMRYKKFEHPPNNSDPLFRDFNNNCVQSECVLFVRIDSFFTFGLSLMMYPRTKRQNTSVLECAFLHLCQ